MTEQQVNHVLSSADLIVRHMAVTGDARPSGYMNLYVFKHGPLYIPRSGEPGKYLGEEYLNVFFDDAGHPTRVWLHQFGPLFDLVKRSHDISLEK